MKEILHKYIVVWLIILLSSCGGGIECIDADDWGTNLSVFVSANPSPTNQQTLTPPGTAPALQYVDWQRGFQLDGTPIYAVINNSAQAVEVITKNNPPAANVNFSCALSSLLIGDNYWTFMMSGLMNHQSACTFSTATSGYPWCPGGSAAPGSVLPVNNAPCKLYMGLGLYSSIVYTEDAKAAPNPPDGASLLCDGSVTKEGGGNTCVVHLGDQACQDPTNCQSPFYSQYCPAGGAIFNPPATCSTGSGACFIYLKILDLFYDDNAGGYNVTFKSGVYNSQLGFISKFVGKVQDILCSVTKSIFTNIVSNAGYLSYVRALLILYIMFVGVGYISGLVQLSSTELMVRVLKMALVIQISATSSSWSFWNNDFFTLFTQGVSDITGIIFGNNGNMVAHVGHSSSGCSFQNLAGFMEFDKLVTNITSYSTTRKILALLTWNAGVVYIVIIFILIGVVLWILLQTIMIYLVSYLVISLLIVLAPLFIPFILFKMTRRLFDSWLKNIISYAIQGIIILAFAFFMLQIFVNQFQYLFGYRVCYKHYYTIPVLDIRISFWQTDYNSEKTCIVTPNAILTSDKVTKNANKDITGGANFAVSTAPGKHTCTLPNGMAQPTNTSNLCLANSCSQERYLGYPYLDPNRSKDSERISQLQDGNLLPWEDLALLILIVLFMWEFNKVVPQIAQKLSGNQRSYASIATAGQEMSGLMASAAGKAGIAVLNQGYKRAFRGRDLGHDLKFAKEAANYQRMKFGGNLEKMPGAVSDAISGAASQASTKIGKAYDKTSLGKSSIGQGMKFGFKALTFAGSSIAKMTLSPTKTMQGAVSSVGEKTFGKVIAKKDAAVDYVKGGVEHYSDLLKQKVQNALDKQKGPQQRTDSDALTKTIDSKPENLESKPEPAGVRVPKELMGADDSALFTPVNTGSARGDLAAIKEKMAPASAQLSSSDSNGPPVSIQPERLVDSAVVSPITQATSIPANAPIGGRPVADVSSAPADQPERPVADVSSAPAGQSERPVVDSTSASLPQAREEREAAPAQSKWGDHDEEGEVVNVRDNPLASQDNARPQPNKVEQVKAEYAAEARAKAREKAREDVNTTGGKFDKKKPK